MDAATLWDGSSPLAEALHGLRTDGAFYCSSTLTAPWSLAMPTMERCVWFHAVTSGRFQIETDDAGTVEVAPGDFVLVPHGRGHTLRTTGAQSKPASVVELPQTMLSERYSLLDYGGGGAVTKLVCGVIRLETSLVGDLGLLLPPLIHLDAESNLQTESIASTLRLLAAEASGQRPGGETVLTRLADILVIQAIRAWLDSNAQTQTGILAAVSDPQIGRALARVHREPTDDWSVDSMARVSGMSRSGFSNRFRTLMDETPMQYVTKVRMQEVQRLLREGASSAGELAHRFGYRSEAAFNRAFKRCVGIGPGAYRRQARQESTASTKTASPTRPSPSASP